MKTSTIIFSAGLALTLLLSACVNQGELRRRDLRDDATMVGLTDTERFAQIRRNASILRGDALESDSPMMRWQAAQNLGTLRASAEIDLLLKRGLSSTADQSANVRRECVLALGHMPIKKALNETRRAVCKALYDRLINTGELEDDSSLGESDGQVRAAMVATLITLGFPEHNTPDQAPRYGFRDVADYLYLIASHHINLNVAGDERVNDLLVERSLGGLERLAGVSAEEWRIARRDLERDFYVEWWSNRISQMPRLDQYKSEVRNG